MLQHTQKIEARSWLHAEEYPLYSVKYLQLLAHIEQTGSLLTAALKTHQSFEAACISVESINNRNNTPLVLHSSAEASGTTAMLTPSGKQLLHTWMRMQSDYQKFLWDLDAGIAATYHFADPNRLLRTIAMKTSARNQLFGRITKVTKGQVNAEVALDIGDGHILFANITNEAIDELQLQPGSAAIAIIKASFVMLSPDPLVRISARNRLSGSIIKLVQGTVNSEVKVELPGGKILTSVVTKESVDEFGFRVGCNCTALIKASHVIIAVE